VLNQVYSIGLIVVHLLKKIGTLDMSRGNLDTHLTATTANIHADIRFEDMQNGLNELSVDRMAIILLYCANYFASREENN